MIIGNSGNIIKMKSYRMLDIVCNYVDFLVLFIIIRCFFSKYIKMFFVMIIISWIIKFIG